MRVSSSSFTTDFLHQIGQLQQQQNKLQQEAATGQKVTLPEDDPLAMTQVLNLQTSAASNTQYQNNVSSLQSSATTSYAAMNSLQSIIDQANQIAAHGSNGTTSPTQLASYQKQVTNLISEAAGIANSKDAQGNYIFGGTVTNTPPFVITKDAGNNITGVTYAGNASVASAEIAPGVTVSAQSPGANTSGSGPAGVFSDSRSGADLFNHLLSLQNDLTPANQSAIATNDVPALGNDETNIVTQISANSVMQATLTNANSIAAAQTTNIAAQISSKTSVDLATAITQLNQTQTAYQAALESGSKIMNLSLLNYLQ